MKRFGIIGDPVDHSMSPVLFTAAYRGKYPYDRIAGSDFKASWERFLREYDGINVTAPFKELAYRAVDRLSPEAARIGAVNLVVKETGPEGWRTTGYNSDYDGVRLALEESPAGPAEGRHALIIGCGGAGKAAAAAALDLGYGLTLVNRDPKRAFALAERLQSSPATATSAAAIRVRPLADLEAALSEADLILYTVPGPLEGFSPERIANLLASDNRPRTLLEANYRAPIFAAGPDARPAHLGEEQAGTAPKLCCGRNQEAARAVVLPACCRYISGRRWLLHQAAAGYIRFTGEVPDTQAISAAI